MTNLKPKMSASYRAIFILSILMAFAVLMAGAATKSNGAGLGVLLWGYQAWLMYKRDNTALVSLTKAILWVQAIAFCILFSVLLFWKSDAKAYINITPQALILLAILCIGIEYVFYRFFRSQASLSALTYPTSVVNSSSIEDEFWEQVSEEVKSGQRVDSLWTRAFSESDGDSNKANARYIKLRFEQIKSKSSGFTRSSNISSSAKKSIKIKFTLFDFWYNFNTVGKVALIGIVCLLTYGILGGNFDPFYNPKASSKDNGIQVAQAPKNIDEYLEKYKPEEINTPDEYLKKYRHLLSEPYNQPIYTEPSTQSSTSTIVSPKNGNCFFVWNDIDRTFVQMDDEIFNYSDIYSNTFIVKIGKESYYQSLIVQLRKADSDNNIPLAKSIAKEIRENSLTVYFDKTLSSEYINLLATKQNLRGKCL